MMPDDCGLVELDIFSGKPNPSWRLSIEQVDFLQASLKSLDVSCEKPIAPDLGYRGFVVTLNNNVRIIIYGGTISIHKKVFLDRDRKLERWLVRTGDQKISEALKQVVLKEIDSN